MEDINREIFKEACELARKKVSLSTYLQKYNFLYSQEKKMIRCPFPDHDDSSPSFSYDDEKQLFHCFGCGRSGDIVNLHYYINQIEDDRYTRVRAVKELAKTFKFTLPDFNTQKIQEETGPKFKRINRKRKPKEEFYKEKVKGLEPKLKYINTKNRIKAYRKIDEMFLQKETAKETYLLITKLLREEK